MTADEKLNHYYAVRDIEVRETNGTIARLAAERDEARDLATMYFNMILIAVRAVHAAVLERTGSQRAAAASVRDVFGLDADGAGKLCLAAGIDGLCVRCRKRPSTQSTGCCAWCDQSQGETE